MRNWTARQRTEVQYGSNRRQPTNGPRVDSRLQFASVQHLWDPRENAGFQFAYRLSEHRQDRVISDQPLTSQSIEASVRLQRRLSAMRGVSLTLGGGATQSRTPPTDLRAATDYVVPIVYGSARLNFTRTWSLSVDARRDISVLDGITPEPFATDAVSVRLTGEPLSRIQLAASWASSRGSSGFDDRSSFDTQTGTVQLQYPVSRSVGVFAAYTNYQHVLRNISPLQSGLPANYNRNSVRVGLTLWLTVLGGS